MPTGPYGPPATAPALLPLLRGPGLVVVAGPPGCGRSTLLRDTAGAFPGPVFAGGGLAALRGVPAVALARAVRARLPAGDPPLLAEAVRSRVRGGLLVVDDLHLADADTLAALPLLAAHCRILAAVRTPHRQPLVDALRPAAALWAAVPPLSGAAAADLVRATAPRLPDAAVAAVVARAGGLPAAVLALARHAATHGPATTLDGFAGTGDTGDTGDGDDVARAVAVSLADLDRPARTALAALGLLGRPAPAAALGGGASLVDAGLAAIDAAGLLTPTSGYIAEVAARILDSDARRALHARLAPLLPPAEAARHHAAAGDTAAAYAAAMTAAAAAATGGERADALLLACDLPGTPATVEVRLAAAAAALAAGRPGAAARAVTAPGTLGVLGVEADTVRGEALLQAGDVAGARAAVQPVPDAAPPAVVAARDRVLLLCDLHTDPPAATARAAAVEARHRADVPPGLAAALAAVRAARRAPGWEHDLQAVAGDALAVRWSAWLLVTHLITDGRLTDAAGAARAAAAACAADLAYAWQTRFAAAALFCDALHAGAPLDEVLRRAADLADRSLPGDARAHTAAAAALVEADTGQLTAARARLAAADPAAPAVAWVAREAAWLDGQPAQAGTPPTATSTASGLLAGLLHITARWAQHDGAPAPAHPVTAPDGPEPVRLTLHAWRTGSGFAAAAHAWPGTARREQVRCLLAEGDHQADPAAAVAALTAAESLAETAGLVVLAGRARRALRRHRVHRDVRGARTDGMSLTDREHEVLALVAQGNPTRRIAGQLGVSTETVETHIRAGMRKLGARTRTEAAARAALPLVVRP
ncbi:helix-turn-helix transcriptional regulator [Spirilliplanes yamanashiensis]|uniref:HTH luxR-type domain-containing protein n=1 Tax=Spirilliplanes yamanashiensis TaxID=42233 RepID=A0A8J4DL57_9ACTN|nr:helix-turn-helix transcriptional regulator [Spirilliplanes yamanashiensis]MDP9817916.1 DNA-binding CsgD family transcriptional regulator [Spirilliplanes yamanashiensis]GIJ04725.1 hypothetical protein Sya03_40770 [Spirilliplanes yamanashiensis]